VTNAFVPLHTDVIILSNTIDRELERTVCIIHIDSPATGSFLRVVKWLQVFVGALNGYIFTRFCFACTEAEVVYHHYHNVTLGDCRFLGLGCAQRAQLVPALP
jgi:hypothetical protein